MRLLEAGERKEAKLQREKEKTSFVTLGEVAKEYLLTLKGGNKRANVSRWRNHISPAFGGKPLKKKSPFDLERFKRTLSKKNLLPKTIHHCLTIIRTI